MAPPPATRYEDPPLPHHDEFADDLTVPYRDDFADDITVAAVDRQAPGPIVDQPATQVTSPVRPATDSIATPSATAGRIRSLQEELPPSSRAWRPPARPNAPNPIATVRSSRSGSRLLVALVGSALVVGLAVALAIVLGARGDATPPASDSLGFFPNEWS